MPNFAPVTGESESLQHMKLLSRYYRNNQNSIYETSVV